MLILSTQLSSMAFESDHQTVHTHMGISQNPTVISLAKKSAQKTEKMLLVAFAMSICFA